LLGTRTINDKEMLLNLTTEVDDISTTGVRNVWLRENTQTTALRMQKRSELQEFL